MARGNERTTTRRTPKDTGRRLKKKPCALCRDKIEWVDYKDVGMLRKYMSDRGKIRARRVTGNCTQHQRKIALAIKTARELVLLPYTQRTTTERSGGRGRGGRPDRPDRPDRPGGADRPRATDVGREAVEATSALSESEAAELERAGGADLDLQIDSASELDIVDVGHEAVELVPVSGDGSETEPPAGAVTDAVGGNGVAAGDVTGNGA